MSTSFNADKLEKFKQTVQGSELEDHFLKMMNIKSLDELNPTHVESLVNPSPTVMQTTASGAPQASKKLPLSTAEATPSQKLSGASDMLRPFVGLHVRYVPRKVTSTYTPSARMMDYIVHLVNSSLCDSYYFKRDCPDYHPYILRLYYGVLFWVQCLRAAHDARALESEQHQFLLRFLENYPPESLTVSSPLLNVLKTLCSSQPEIATYGKVHPSLPTNPGPTRRDSFMVDLSFAHFMPNIPGILALLADLNSKINPPAGTQAVYPAKGKHTPVPSGNRTQATIFGHFSFAATGTITERQRWFLASSGLQYPCEADKKLNESFAERYDSFCFPTLAANDDLRFYESFFSMDGSMGWFAQVRDVAAFEAKFFEGSGTLADCAPSGIVSNQIQVVYSDPGTPPTAPTYSADPAALFPFSFRLRTSSRSMPELAEAMAALAHTHIQAPSNHPRFPNFGTKLDEDGPFWGIRPVESSPKDDSSYLDLKSIVKGLLKQKPS